MEAVKVQRTPQWNAVIADRVSTTTTVAIDMVDAAAAIREVEIHLKSDRVIIRARAEDLREVFKHRHE